MRFCLVDSYFFSSDNHESKLIFIKRKSNKELHRRYSKHLESYIHTTSSASRFNSDA